MSRSSQRDRELVSRHRQIWASRPELRSVYEEWFGRLLSWVRGQQPVVEIGSGPGFFKEYCPALISTDVLRYPWIDVPCDACTLPFRSGAVGALVMVDVLHHLARPLDFMVEAARVLAPGGRLAAVEPWITPLSFVLYRYLHHEECRLRVDLAHAFDESRKQAFDGNAAIPFRLLRHLRGDAAGGPLRLLSAHSFPALPYLVTFGFKRGRPVPRRLVALAAGCERALGPLGRFFATRICVVWDNAG